MAMKITDLPVDALSNVLASVAKLSDGATDIAKSMSVCKRFLEASKSNIVYKVVCFQKVEVLSQHRLFQRTDGLLYSCASAGNRFAQFLLAQVILKSSSQLMRFGIKSSRLKFFRGYSFRYDSIGIKCQESHLVASFMASFIPGLGFRPFLPHWELLKIFLSNSNRIDILTMRPHIHTYVEYFRGRHSRDRTDAANVFHRAVNSMCNMDEHNPHTSLLTRAGHHYYVINDIRNANNVDEDVRAKALFDFDRVSRVFPDFVVPKQKKQLSAP